MPGYTTPDGEEIVIRVVTRSDVSKLYTFYNKMIGTAPFSRYFNQSDSEEKKKKWINDYIESDYQTLVVAEAKNEIIGSIGLELTDVPGASHVGTLRGISVIEAWKGKDISRHIVAGVLSLAKIVGLELIILSIRSGNNLAISLFISAGFTEYGSLPQGRKIDGKYYDSIMLFKKL